MKLTPRYYQSEAAEAVYPFWFPFTGTWPVIVLPTGAGKSLTLALICEKVVKEWKGRVIVATHVKELIEQNAAELRDAADDLDIGIYSAGLGRRDLDHDILVCGIQSVYKRAHELGRRHAVIIDEAHLTPDEGDGMYRTFVSDLSAINPKLRGCGLTATPFRTSTGPLCHPKGIFQKVAYSAPVTRLIADGFLAPIVNRETVKHYATESLKAHNGEFRAADVENLFGEDDAKISAAVAEALTKAAARHSILWFCSGVRHAEKVAAEITKQSGQQADCVTGSTGDLERMTALNDFKEQRLRHLINMNVLTTGFNARCIDAIVVLRATESPGLFAQMLGRGFRTHESKVDCLVLDFGGNFQRHGPIDAEDYGRRKGQHGEKTGEAPVKPCPNCEKEVHAAAVECEHCGFRFPPRSLKHGTEADTESNVYDKPPEPKRWTVKSWEAMRHAKKGAAKPTVGCPGCALAAFDRPCEECAYTPVPETLRINYSVVPEGVDGELAAEVVSEWVCVAHLGDDRAHKFARRNAEKWWASHSISECPRTIEEALKLFNEKALAMPEALVTIADGRFTRITNRTLGKLPETWGVGDSWESDPADEWATLPARSEWEQPVDEVPF